MVKKTELKPEMKKAIKAIVRAEEDQPEVKQVQYNNTATFLASNNAGAIVPLIIGTTAAQLSIGSGSTQRVGTIIRLKEIDWRHTAYVDGGANGSSVRMITYVDNEYSGVAAALFGGNEPMFNTTNVAGQSINYTFNTDTCGRGKKFTILKDRIYNTSVDGVVNAAADAGFQTIHYKKVFKGEGQKILLAPGNVVGEGVAQNKQYYILFLASNGAAQNNRIAEACWSLKYTDN